MVEKFKNSMKSYFSNGPKAIFIVLLILMISTIVIINTRKTLYVYVDGKEKKIITFRTHLKDALSANDIVVGPKDKTTIGLDSKINNNDKIYIKKKLMVRN